MNRLKFVAHAILILTLTITSVPLYTTPVAAEGRDCSYDFYSTNEILVYDPCTQICEIGSGSPSVFDTASSPVTNPSPLTDTSLAKVVDYKNNEILTTSDLQKIQLYKPFYIKAADKVGIPWEMIAVIHYRETRLSRVNPGNGQGLYQDYARINGPYPAGATTDAEFQRQTDWAASFLLEKAGSKQTGLKNADDNAVKYTFFGYNGRASVYIDQAIKLGFTQEQAKNGEGSPYVMNIADAVRDPATNPDGWGQIKTDGGKIQYPANKDHGAFVMYAALRGKITSSSGCDSPLSNLGSLTEGGLTREQAKQFVMNYGANKNDSTKTLLMTGGNYWTGSSGGYNYGSNCVSFTRFFLMKFTDTNVSGPMGDGSDVVSNLAKKGVPTGTEPRVFAVFSTPGNPGHTGVVLGIHGDTLIVGHASYGRSAYGVQGAGDGTSEGTGVAFIKVGTLDGQTNIWWGSGKPTFAYPRTVDTKAIETYLTTGV